MTHPDDAPAARLDALAQDYVRRLRAGEAVDPKAVAEAHPSLAGEIRELFPVLSLMEGLKPPSAPPAVHAPEPEHSVAPRPLPATVGPYRVVREIGRGGMGRVLEAQDEAGRRVALKLIHPHLVEQEGFLARFLREIEAGRRVAHTGVVGALDSGVTVEAGREIPYLALEYVEGQDLERLIAEAGTVSERLAREIGLRVAEALHAVHEAGLVHRDVKPANVIITIDETVKLMDLGVALVRDEVLRLTQTGQFVGSLLYAAPEQLRGARIGPRTDLYALGLLLFELLSGRHAHADPEGALPAVPDLGRTPPVLRAAAPRVSPFLDRLVTVLLAPDPEDRIASAAALTTILEEGESSAWWQAQQAAPDARPRVRRLAEGTPLVGRTQELEALDASLARVRAGGGQVLLLEGEAGIGKSHLVAAWLDRTDGDATGSLRILVAEHGPGRDLAGPHPLAHALLRTLGSQDLERRLAALLGESAALAPTLARHLRGAEGTVPDGDLSASARTQAFVLLLRALAEESPVVLWIEDLHYGSEEDQALFLRLAHALEEDAVLLLGSARPGLPERLLTEVARLPHGRHLPIGGLDREAAFALVAQALGEGRAWSGGAGDLVRSADGNPYCLLEFVRELETRRDDRTARRGARPTDLRIPRSLRQLVEERLRSVPDDARALLSVAACCGDLFDPVLVCAAGEVPKLAGLRMLHHVERVHRLLRPDGPHYRFHHHLVQEFLHDELPDALRAAYHTALANALESQLGAQDGAPVSTDQAHQLTRGFLLGESPERALPYADRALRHVYGRSEFHRSAALARRLLALGDVLPPALQASAQHNLALCLLASAPPKEALDPLTEAQRLAADLGDEALVVRTLVHRALCERNLGRSEEGLRRTEEAARRAAALGDAGLEAQALGEMAMALADLGRNAKARDVARRALGLSRQAGDATRVFQIARNLGGIELELGHMEDAAVLLEMAASGAQLHGELITEASALTVLGKLHYLRAEMADALGILERVFVIGRETGHARMQAVVGANVAQTLMHLGRFEEARRRALQADELAQAMEYRDVRAHALLALAHVQAGQGAFEAAERTMEEARALTEGARSPVLEARLYFLPAQLLAWTGRFDGAYAAVDGGLAAVQGAGAPREEALMLFAAGVVRDAEGKRGEAAKFLERALATLRELDLRHEVATVGPWLGEVLVALERLDEAQTVLEEALAIAAGGDLIGTATLCRVWLDLLPGGNLVRARIALERHADIVGAYAHLRALHALARGTGDANLAAGAHTALSRLIAAAPEATRAAMGERVPLHRAILVES